MNNNSNNQPPRSRSRDRPLVSPRSENPWRPQFDQGSDQTNHFHDRTSYDSETSNRNRLLFPSQHQNHVREDRSRSPGFPSNWVQPVSQNSNNNNDNDNNEFLENYLRQPLADPRALPQNAQRQHQQQLLAKYIKHIDSEGEWHPTTAAPSSNDNSLQSLPSAANNNMNQKQFQNNNNRRQPDSARASDREYEADRSTNYFPPSSHDNVAKSPKIQRELSPAARKSREKM